MKKFLAVLLVALMCLSVLAACSTPAEPEDSEAPETSNTNSPENNETSESAGEDTSDEEPSDVESSTPGETDSGLAAAKEMVKTLNKNLLTTPSTGKDFTVTPQVMIAGVVYTITWTVNTDKVTVVVDETAKTVTINVDEDSIEDVAYVLTATITSPEGTTETLEFNLTVPKFKFTTYAEYAAAENKAFVTVQGIVTGVFSKSTGSAANGLYLQDMNNEGGYYVYNLADDPNGTILPGMTVVVRGDKDLYNGTYEIINASVQIVDETIKTVEPIDYTALLANASKLSDAELVAKQALLVTVKNVTILEVGDNGYYYFQAGAHKVYLRISSSNNATTSEALAAIKAAFAANNGNTATVTGVISLYNGNFYLSPVSADAFSNFTEPERDDAGKVEFEINALKLDSSASSNKVITLAANGTKYDNVVFTWSVVGETEAAVIADGKLTLTIPDKATVVKISVTATCGEATATKEFEIKLSKEITSIKDALEIGAAKEHNTYTTEKYLIAGIITEIYNAQYGNMYIVDELGNKFTVYGAYSADGANRFDAMESKPAVGDYVVVLGVLGQYNGTAQTKNAWIQSWTTPTTIPGVLETVKDFTKNQYTDNKVIISGEITEVQNATYGNVVIKDAAGNSILVYGLYSANGATRYDAMETKPAVGDTITVLGIVGKYNDAQMKNGWLIGYTAGSTEGGEETETTVETETTEETESTESNEDNEVEKNVLTIAEAIALGKTFEKDKYTTEKYYLTGVVESVYNTTYGNIYLTDGVNTIIVYGLYSEDGTVRYDAMTAKPVAGDTITVYGVIGYYSSAQMKNGWLVEHTAHTCEYSEATCSVPATCTICKATTGTTLPHAEWNDATCTTPKSCKACGAKEGDPIDHTYVDGVCSECGHTEGTVEESRLLANFDFGANGSAAHVDGNDYGTAKSFSADGYTLSLTGMSKVYGPAFDAKGNSCIKLGTSKVVGTFSFTVADDVNKVVIYVAKYKANTTKISVNGTAYTINGASDNGAYDAIEIDTTTNKTVSFETVSGGVRCMINGIEFWS